MRIEFQYEDGELAYMDELASPPRVGESIVFPSERQVQVVGVQWRLDASRPYIRATIKLPKGSPEV